MNHVDASWIAYRKANPKAHLRLFCFPYAGAGASLFRTWGQDLPSWIEVCPIQLPGRESRYVELAYERIEPLVEALSGGLEPFLDQPYAFFGHSMGALIAFELARVLRARNRRLPSYMFVSGSRGPRRSNPYPSTLGLPDEQLVRELSNMGGTPEGILQNPEILKFLLPTIRADFALCETYAYRSSAILDFPLKVYGGRNDVKVTEEDLQSWGLETSAGCRVAIFDGDHFFVNSCRSAVLKDLSDVLRSNFTSRPQFARPVFA